MCCLPIGPVKNVSSIISFGNVYFAIKVIHVFSIIKCIIKLNLFDQSLLLFDIHIFGYLFPALSLKPSLSYLIVTQNGSWWENGEYKNGLEHSEEMTVCSHNPARQLSCSGPATEVPQTQLIFFISHFFFVFL